MEASDFLMQKYKEHREQARQHETLRTTVVVFTFATAGAIFTFAGSGDTQPAFRIAAAVFLIALGVFSALVCFKHYEQIRYHMSIARGYDFRLRSVLGDESGSHEQVKALKEQHKKKFGWAAERELHLVWIVFPVLIALLGIILVAVQI